MPIHFLLAEGEKLPVNICRNGGRTRIEPSIFFKDDPIFCNESKAGRDPIHRTFPAAGKRTGVESRGKFTLGAEISGKTFSLSCRKIAAVKMKQYFRGKGKKAPFPHFHTVAEGKPPFREGKKGIFCREEGDLFFPPMEFFRGRRPGKDPFLIAGRGQDQGGGKLPFFSGKHPVVKTAGGGKEGTAENKKDIFPFQLFHQFLGGTKGIFLQHTLQKEILTACSCNGKLRKETNGTAFEGRLFCTFRHFPGIVKWICYLPGRHRTSYSLKTKHFPSFLYKYTPKREGIQVRLQKRASPFQTLCRKSTGKGGETGFP